MVICLICAICVPVKEPPSEHSTVLSGYTGNELLKGMDMVHNYLIHSNEVQLIDKEQIHEAVEELVEKLNLAAGSTEGFDLYKLIETYFIDMDKRHEINDLLSIPQEPEYVEEN